MSQDRNRPSRTYVLDDEGKPQQEPNWERWLAWRQAHDEPLAETPLAPRVLVTTRFTGLDQRRTETDAPVLWETMVFGGPRNLHQERYTSQAAALNGHDATLYRLLGDHGGCASGHRPVAGSGPDMDKTPSVAQADKA